MRWHLHWLSRTKRPHWLDRTTSTAILFGIGSGQVEDATGLSCSVRYLHSPLTFAFGWRTDKQSPRVVHAVTATGLQCKFLLHLQRWQAEEPRVVHMTITTRIHCNWGGNCRHTGGGSRNLWQWPTGRYACFSGFIDMPRSLKMSPQLLVTHSIDMAA